MNSGWKGPDFTLMPGENRLYRYNYTKDEASDIAVSLVMNVSLLTIPGNASGLYNATLIAKGKSLPGSGLTWVITFLGLITLGVVVQSLRKNRE